jgi:hypothetical protein
MAEVMVILSTSSLDNAIAQLKILSETRGDGQGEQSLSSINTLLDDLAVTRSASTQSQERRLDPQKIAALSVNFQIIK